MRHFFGLSVVLVSLWACASPAAVVAPDDAAENPEDYWRVGVLEFDGDPEVGGSLAGSIEETLINCGILVVDRSIIANVLAERETEAIDYVALGKLVGADVLITGVTITSNLLLAEGMSLGGTYRGVSTQDGVVVFSGQLVRGGYSPQYVGRKAGNAICDAFDEL